MSSQKNIATVQRYFADCLNQSGAPDPGPALALLDELLVEDFVMSYNNQTNDAAMHGLAKHQEFVLRHARNFTEANWIVEELLAGEDSVACQWRILATHTASGNRIDVRAVDMYRMRDGRIAELRRFLDYKSLNEQIQSPERVSTAVSSAAPSGPSASTTRHGPPPGRGARP
jgi:ketosteroid isomerase-like protein